MRTDFETLRSMAVYILNHLKENNLVEFPVDKRADLIEALATELAVSFATDEDIRDQALEEIEEKMGRDALVEDITESEIYNHARKEIVKSFNGENIAGLYLVESLRQVGVRVTKFLMDCDLVDDVFGEDEELITFLVSRVRNFSR